MNPTAELTSYLHTTHIQLLVERGILTPSEAVDVLEHLPSFDAELGDLKRLVLLDILRGLSDEWIQENHCYQGETI